MLRKSAIKSYGQRKENEDENFSSRVKADAARRCLRRGRSGGLGNGESYPTLSLVLVLTIILADLVFNLAPARPSCTAASH